MGLAPALPHVVIVGGGFGGLSCARALAGAPVRITLLDRQNHHLFQPLLYQVATAALSPAQIAAPLRQILARQQNVSVVLAEVTGLDPERRRLVAGGREFAYDVLVLAAGSETFWFGNEAWRQAAPGLKTVADALEIRERLVEALELAEQSQDEATRDKLLTFVVIGGGPTGVEMAGAIREIALQLVPREFRRIDTTTARVVLVEAQDTLLPSGFHEALCRRAAADLVALGVEVRLATRVSGIDAGGVDLVFRNGAERIRSRNVIWAAGVRPSPLAERLGVTVQKSGRVAVEPDLSLPGRPEIFVIGDMAQVATRRDGAPVPAIAPAAMQMGRHAGRIIATGRRLPFRYRDRGMLATIGRARAVGTIRRLRVTGLTAWLLWSGIHVYYLISFRQRLLVMLDWIWSYIFFAGGARLITGAGGRGGKAGRPDTPDTEV